MQLYTFLASSCGLGGQLKKGWVHGGVRKRRRRRKGSGRGREEGCQGFIQDFEFGGGGGGGGGTGW